MLLLLATGVPLSDISDYVSSLDSGYGSDTDSSISSVFGACWLSYSRCWAVESSCSSSCQLLSDLR
jgi:hypothetical protein